MEGACYVLVSTQLLSEKNAVITKTTNNPYFAGVEGKKDREAPKGGGGFAMIFGPDGRPLCEALEKGEEGVLTADIELSMIDFAKQVSKFLFYVECPNSRH